MSHYESGGPKFRQDRLTGTALLAAAASLAFFASGLVGSKPSRTSKYKGNAYIQAQPIPGTLPKAVQRNAASSLDVYYASGSSTYLQGSGIKIGSNLVATAGHVILESNKKAAISCDYSYTQNVYSTPANNGEVITARAATFNPAHTAKAHFYDTDFGLLRVKPDNQFSRLPVASLAKKPVRLGETVYFVNYETGPDGSYYPNAAEGRASKGFGHAAEYAGTIIGHRGQMIVVATGLQAYGPETNRVWDTYQGASGGPVFNGQGQVVGESIEIDPPMLSQSIDSYYKVRLPIGSGTLIAGITYVQPITPGLVSRFTQQLQETGCTQ